MSSNVKLIIRFADSETSVSILCVAISYIKCSLEIPSQALPLSTSGDLDRLHDRVGQVVSPLTPGDCNDPHLFLGLFFFLHLGSHDDSHDQQWVNSHFESGRHSLRF